MVDQCSNFLRHITVLYTSLFTNGFGFMTGLVGSLGYWLEQQGVNRGSQPWYYYWLIQLPIYEFLPFLGTLLALIFAPALLKKKKPEAVSSEGSAGVSIEGYKNEQPGEPVQDADKPLPEVSVSHFSCTGVFPASWHIQLPVKRCPGSPCTCPLA